jgi:hypothetical protein
MNEMIYHWQIYETMCFRFWFRQVCTHPDSYLVREGQTGMLGRVVCPDCGYVREWNAY